jgi:putative phosphoesterase
MRIGVVSDTHNNLRNVKRIVALFGAAGVERVIHTGDITQPRTLCALAEVGVPILAVFGNNDEREALLDSAADLAVELTEPPFEWVIASRRILVAHDPVELEGAIEDEHAVVLHGHTHRRTIERSEGRLLFNPGECAGHLPGRQTVGVVDLETLEPDLLHF